MSQDYRRPREGGDPASFLKRHWVPAPDYHLGGRLFAGTTIADQGCHAFPQDSVGRMQSLPFGSIYFVFAAGYFLSYAFRVVNAVIAPDLTSELALDPSSLGLLTGAYLLAFGLMQIPAGILLDRYGPRRVEPVLLALAAAGAIGFGMADSLTSVGNVETGK